MQYDFGVGLITFIPPGANPTPQRCGVLQDVSLDITQTKKKLVGQKKVAVDIAESELDFTGKAKFAAIFGNTVLNVLQGATQATGTTVGVQDEIGTVPGSGPYTIQVVNNSTFVDDLGVYDVTAQKLLKCVTGVPATGQYAVAAGVYTFAAADTAHVMWISYDYTIAGGLTTSYSNQLMGAAATFTLRLFNQYSVQGTVKYFGWKFYAATIPKLAFALKNTDYTMQNVDFDCFEGTNGKIFDYYTSE